jgi:hypothetical protein
MRLLGSGPVVLVVVLALASGCGGGGKAAPQAAPGPAQQILTREDVNKYARDTPEYAFLNWWRDAQYANLRGYLDAFPKPVRKQIEDDPRTPRALGQFSGFISVARPVIGDTRRRAGTATIYVEIKYRTPIGAKRFVTTTRPQAFVLVRERGEWLLADDAFVQASLPANLRRRA